MNSTATREMDAAMADAGMLPVSDYVDLHKDDEDLGSAAVLAAAAEQSATLSLNTYQARTADTAIYPGKGTPLGLIYCALKLAGEAGEVSEKVGKAIRDDGMVAHTGGTMAGLRQLNWQFASIGLHPERRDDLKKELGDVLWYVASAARELGFDLSDVAQANLDKLAGRKERGTLQGSGDNR